MKRVTAAPSVPEAVDASDDFAVTLIDWQRGHGRHQLPWQRTRDAYRIWLSEIMLQQTQVATVIPYYERFLARFPTVEALAVARVEDVMSLWSGLGYYTRARNLHRCAQQVVAEHEGAFPRDPQALAALPGIGPSTAAAIAAFAYGARAAILDGNVKRVFCRVFGIEGFPGQPAIERRLWARAEQLLPLRNIEAYTQGLMDLGATVCTRSRPQCGRCPMRARCVALATDRVADLPARKPKKALPEKSTVMLVVMYRGQVLLEQRPAHGIWGGLLSLPEQSRLQPQPSATDAAGIARALADFGKVKDMAPLPAFAHTFTHYRLQITPLQVRLANRSSLPRGSDYRWLSRTALADAPLPAPVRKLLARLSDS